jgi:hypothetical protein
VSTTLRHMLREFSEFYFLRELALWKRVEELDYAERKIALTRVVGLLEDFASQVLLRRRSEPQSIRYGNEIGFDYVPARKSRVLSVMNLIASTMQSPLVQVSFMHPKVSICTARNGEGCKHPHDEGIGKITDVAEWDERASETDGREDEESDPRSLVGQFPAPIKPRTDPVPETQTNKSVGASLHAC